MCSGDDHVGRAGLVQQIGGLHNASAGVDHVVGEDAQPACHVTDDPVRDNLVGDIEIAGLVNERDRSATEPVRPLLGGPDASGVGGYDGEAFVRVRLGDVAGQ